MNYKAEITIDNDQIHDAIKQEITQRSRTTEKITKKDGKTIINIESKDSTALRASLNSITKTCTVWEKMQNIK